MQLLKIDKENYVGQADPFILKHNDKYYIYTTGDDGLYAHSCDTLLGDWKFEGRIFTIEGKDHFWAPSAIYHEGKLYQLKGDKRFNGVKYVQIFHRAKHILKGEDSEFLGL